jgi:hypothetical protein
MSTGARRPVILTPLIIDGQQVISLTMIQVVRCTESTGRSVSSIKNLSNSDYILQFHWSSLEKLQSTPLTVSIPPMSRHLYLNTFGMCLVRFSWLVSQPLSSLKPLSDSWPKVTLDLISSNMETVISRVGSSSLATSSSLVMLQVLQNNADDVLLVLPLLLLETWWKLWKESRLFQVYRHRVWHSPACLCAGKVSFSLISSNGEWAEK